MTLPKGCERRWSRHQGTRFREGSILSRPSAMRFESAAFAFEDHSKTEHSSDDDYVEDGLEGT